MLRLLRYAVLIGIAVVLATPAFTAGLLKPLDAEDVSLEIVSHDVGVVINSGFAITTVDQVFLNPTDRDLEAVYTFPLPRQASLSELSLWIDGQEVVGEVVASERAREIHQLERGSGRETALAEKRDYHAFDIRVSPVRAGDETRIRLVYLQPLKIDHNVGRYVYPLEEGFADQQVHAFWDMRSEVRGRFRFQCSIRSSYPIESVRATGYDALTNVVSGAAGDWSVSIEDLEGTSSLHNDVVVYYRLAENTPARVDLLPYRTGEGPGSYLLAITPGNELREITEGVDWTVVLDNSGSMDSKLSTAVEAVALALHSMEPPDRFRVALFSSHGRWLIRDWQPVNEINLQAAADTLAGVEIEGGTNLHAGLDLGWRGLDSDRSSGILLVSDGGANTGPTRHADFVKLLEDKDVRVFTFVLGQGANVPLLERIAEESGGFSMAVSNRDDLYGRILQARERLSREAMHGFRVELEGVEADEVAPSRIPTLYHGQQFVQLGRYGEPGEATLRVWARISGEEHSWETRIVFPEYDDSYPEIERMWALARTRDVMDQVREHGESEELRATIIDVATEYSIVTDYTSMVVVRPERFEEHGIGRRNRDRVARERQGRDERRAVEPRATRADSGRPMYGGRPSHGLGGGAVSPSLLWLLAGAYVAGRLLRRTER